MANLRPKMRQNLRSKRLKTWQKSKGMSRISAVYYAMYFSVGKIRCVNVALGWDRKHECDNALGRFIVGQRGDYPCGSLWVSSHGSYFLHKISAASMQGNPQDKTCRFVDLLLQI